MATTNNNIHTSVDLADYEYIHHPQAFFSAHLQQQKQQYNWLYDPIDSFLPMQTSFMTDDMTSNNTSQHPLYTE